jgi:hypothetical protein
MRWERRQQNPNELHRVFVWLPKRLQTEDPYCTHFVWLETMYRVHNVNQYGTYHKGSYIHWIYYTRDEAVLRRLLPANPEVA